MTTTTTEIDWKAAEAVAAGLGLHTRQLVDARDTEQARQWAVTMSRENGSSTRAISYSELAVMLGHHAPAVKDPERRNWHDLLKAAEQLAATVKVKAAEDDARAKAEADAKAAVEAAEADQEEEHDAGV